MDNAKCLHDCGHSGGSVECSVFDKRKPESECGPDCCEYGPSGAAYAAVWLDDYDLTYGAYKVFRDRDECLDYLVDVVFRRAAMLGVDVVDQGARPVKNEDLETVFPKMTREQVRRQLDSGMDFSLVLETAMSFGSLDVVRQVTVGMRDVEIA